MLSLRSPLAAGRAGARREMRVARSLHGSNAPHYAAPATLYTGQVRGARSRARHTAGRSRRRAAPRAPPVGRMCAPAQSRAPACTPPQRSNPHGQNYRLCAARLSPRTHPQDPDGSLCPYSQSTMIALLEKQVPFELKQVTRVVSGECVALRVCGVRASLPVCALAQRGEVSKQVPFEIKQARQAVGVASVLCLCRVCAQGVRTRTIIDPVLHCLHTHPGGPCAQGRGLQGAVSCRDPAA